MKKAKPWSEILAQFRMIHGNRFDYDESSYVNMKTPMQMSCKEHGEFSRSPIDHIRLKYICRKCSIIEVGKNKRITWADFVKRATEKHEGRYKYIRFIGEEFTGYNCEVEIECLEHGVFQQQVRYHIAGSGCPKCALVRTGATKHFNLIDLPKNGQLTTEQYLSLLPSDNFQKYDYSRVNYIGGKKSIEIRCIQHDDWFWQNATKHKNGNGCPQCAYNQKVAKPSSFYLERCKKQYGDLYNYDESTFGNGSHGRISYECNLCGHINDQLLYSHDLLGHGCVGCGISKEEREIYSFLTSELLLGEVIINDRKILNGLELDFHIPSKNFAIEHDGTYYHAENGGNKDRFYHLKKTELCEESNIQLIHIFEDEWRFKGNICKSLLRNKLGATQDRIYARKCEVKIIEYKTKNEFLNQNHIQGEDVSRINLGLFYQNSLVSLMTFSVPRYDKTVEWELSRFCNKLDTTVVGGASKLLAFFIKNYNPNTIISYADRRWSDGGLYITLGFSLIRTSMPRYYYMDKKNYIIREHRSNYTKDRIRKKFPEFDITGKTEWDAMQELGYDRIWDCGVRAYVWTK